MADRRKTITLSVAVAVAVLAAVVNTAWLAVLLFVLAAFLIAWGLQPKRTHRAHPDYGFEGGLVHRGLWRQRYANVSRSAISAVDRRP
jgi:hypothetical protein